MGMSKTYQTWYVHWKC